MVDIVLVNWNSGRQLAACISSILSSSQSNTAVGRVTVVDNGSTDESLALAEAVGRGRISLIRNNSNLGFGRACNQGANLGRSEFLLFLNPDVVLERHSIELATYALVHGDPSIAVCGISLVDKSGNVARTCARKATAWNMSLHALGLDRLAPTLMGSYVMTEWDHAETRSVEHVIGAFYLVKRSIFEAVGGFDERFFMYLEDLDLSCRIRRAGWKCLYFVGARAFHEGGGSSKKVLSQRLFYSLRSRLQYASKHFDPIGRIGVSAITLVLEPLIRFGKSLARGDIQSFRHTFQGYRLLYSWCIGSARKSGSCLSAQP